MESNAVVLPKDANMRFQTKTLYDQVADVFISRILSGAWKPGPAIPGEQELAADLNLSVGTVRKALDILERRKLIERRRGRGTFVVDHASGKVPSRFSALQQGDGEIANAKAIVISTAIGSATDEERNRLRLAEGEDCVRLCQVRLLNDEAFMVEEVSLPSRLFPHLLDTVPIPTRITSMTQRYGLLPDHAVEEVTVRALPEDAARDLGVDAGTAMLHIDRVVFTDKDRPLEWRRGYCKLGKHIRYRVAVS